MQLYVNYVPFLCDFFLNIVTPLSAFYLEPLLSFKSCTKRTQAVSWRNTFKLFSFQVMYRYMIGYNISHFKVQPISFHSSFVPLMGVKAVSLLYHRLIHVFFSLLYCLPRIRLKGRNPFHSREYTVLYNMYNVLFNCCILMLVISNCVIDQSDFAICIYAYMKITLYRRNTTLVSWLE